jgi:hypothetical protein
MTRAIKVGHKWQRAKLMYIKLPMYLLFMYINNRYINSYTVADQSATYFVLVRN